MWLTAACMRLLATNLDSGVNVAQSARIRTVADCRVESISRTVNVEEAAASLMLISMLQLASVSARFATSASILFTPSAASALACQSLLHV
jgi:hypothetical protein